MADGILKLKDGTVYDDSDCGYSDRYIWCWLKNATFSQAFADFSDPAKTSEIHVIHGNHETIYTGFTDLDLVRKSEYEPGKYTVNVRLTGENIHIEEQDIPEPEDVNSDGTV